MAEVYRCDRCGKIFNEISDVVNESVGFMMGLHIARWSPNNSVDVCPSCANLLRVFLDKWFYNNPKEKRHKKNSNRGE